MVGACVGGGGLSLLPYLPLLKKNDFQHEIQNRNQLFFRDF
jgi:hypothetical protein